VSVRILTGDCRALLATLDGESVQAVVTSPPYFGLRDYGHAGQIGMEATPDAYVAEMVAVFREVRRVLRADGTLWLNLGDSYAGSWGAQGRQGASGQMAARSVASARQIAAAAKRESRTGSIPPGAGYKAKDLLGIPWRVAFALQADGWWLRSDIIWAKPNPMPESVTDRPTKAHEYLFLLTKGERYYYDAEAVAEPAMTAEEAVYDPGTNGLSGADRQTGATTRRFKAGRAGNKTRTYGGAIGDRPDDHMGRSVPWEGITRNRRTVWTIPSQPYKGAHFATMPPALVEPCILAGSKPGDTVLDPFGGAGTTGLVADRLGRNAILLELNPEYARLAESRIHADAPLLVQVGGCV
jgi:DNA modification methylase